ncbi:MAG: helix-turn-helix domain-containing protein [Anaerovoracaceae bacterium]
MIKGFQWETAEEMDKKLAERVKAIRKRRGITQEELSEKSGVSYGSIKRFETTGMISLLSLTKLAVALGCSNEISDMFTQVEYRNIQEVINENK